MDEELRDAHNFRIGVIKDQGAFLVIYDAHNNKCGTYEKATRITRDVHNNKVGTGNLLVLLLPR